jgi:hypothetical protein
MTAQTKDQDPAPRVPAFPRPDGVRGLRMWCAWCDRWHSHGPGYGHRAAHCRNGRSPYLRTGYVLIDPVETGR